MGSSVALDASFGTLWVLALLVASLAVIGTQHVPQAARIGAKAIFITALAVRLVPALVLNAGASADITSYWIIGHLVVAGRDIYTSPAAAGHYPYLPAQLWLSALSVHLAGALKGLIPFVVLMKIPPVLADAGTALLLIIGLRSRGVSRSRASIAGLAYALNPVSTLVASYHGQFDALPLFFCILAWALVPTTNDARGIASTVPAGLALGAAILFKTWPVLVLPAFLIAVRRDRALMAGVFIGACLVPLAGTLGYTLIYHVPIRRLAETTLGYSSTPGWWGLGALSAWLHGRGHLLSVSGITAVARFTELLVVVCAVAIPFRFRDRPLEWNILAVLLLFYVLSANFAVQYLAWILPFGMLSLVGPFRTSRAFAMFVAGSTAAILVTYMIAGWIYHTIPGQTPLVTKGWQVGFYAVYAISIWWCAQQLRVRRDTSHWR